MKRAFTLIELIVVIVVFIMLVILLIPEVHVIEGAAQRVNCLANQNNIWKNISAWGLNPADSFRPNVSNSHLIGTGDVLNAECRITPETFVCPSAARDYGIKPAVSLESMTPSHICYNYFMFLPGLARDSDKVLICDMNGPNTIAGPSKTNWGRNHRNKNGESQGGNLLKVAGQGKWVDMIEITNTDIILSFQGITNIDIMTVIKNHSLPPRLATAISYPARSRRPPAKTLAIIRIAELMTADLHRLDAQGMLLPV